MSRLVVVGDVLLDVDADGRADRLCPDAPAPVVAGARRTARPGGAGLAAGLLARDGHDVTLICALGRGSAARTVAGLLDDLGVHVVDLGRGGATPEKTRIRVRGQVLLRLDDEGEPPGVAAPGDDALAALAAADAVLVSDYGRGMAAAPPLRRALAAVAAPVVWDPHPRGPEPVRGAWLVTPNAAEAEALARGVPDAGRSARELRWRLAARAVAVTVGADGAVLVEGAGPAVRIPPPARRAGDPCGAGDRFATAATAAAAAGLPVAEAVAAGVAAAEAMIAAGGPGPALRRPPADAASTDPRGAVRARGGRVVATGGCFDLLHAGHVAMLEAARSLGDHLVVLLNSDASVRRLKGADRPLVAQEDRERLLRALRAVDDVLVFDEDTPEAALARLRPDVWAKGADYEAAELPEAAVVHAAGGEVVVLPYVAGRSTTRLIEEVAHRATR